MRSFLLQPQALVRFLGQTTCRQRRTLWPGTGLTGQHVRGMSRAYEDHEQAVLLKNEDEGLGKTKKVYSRDKKKKHGQQENVRHHPPSSHTPAPKPTTRRHVSPRPVGELYPSFSSDGLSFEALGLDRKFVTALRTAFPDVNQPTEVQEKLIPELLGGKDILLKDNTGSGKSFGIVLALLSKARRTLVDEETGQRTRLITSLFIVPHRDLAYQFTDWIKRLVDAIPSDERPSLESVVQVLVRGGDKAYSSSIDQLKKEPPHILICTPQAFMDVYGLDHGALGLETLQAVVVDEVDYLVETAARKDPNKSYRKAYEKAKRAIEKHPGQTREILNMIYARRKELAEMTRRREEEEDGDGDVNSHRVAWRCAREKEEKIPQLVMSSATLRVHLRDYLFEESGWLNPYNLVKVFGKGKEGTPQGILHSVLVVGQDGVIRNIEEAIPAPKEREPVEILDVEEDVHVEWNSEYENSSSPFDANVMEAIATTFALDVGQMGLVVIGSSSPVARAVYELRQLGVDAYGLEYSKGADLVSGKKGTLLVGTVATTRGMDLTGLSHVFVIGLPYCGAGDKITSSSVDGYVHIAGRVARFGQRGKVISIVTEPQGHKLVRILNTIKATPVRFEEFD